MLQGRFPKHQAKGQSNKQAVTDYKHKEKLERAHRSKDKLSKKRRNTGGLIWREG